VREASFLAVLLLLAGCNRANQNRDAIRQGVIDHLATASINVAAMDMDLTAIQFNGDKADVTVTFKPKGAGATQGMALRYRMQEKDGKWAVVGIQDSGHGGATQPGAPNPHDGSAAPASNPHAMPSPEDLPPTGQK
jgi:hypothetical protein